MAARGAICAAAAVAFLPTAAVRAAPSPPRSPVPAPALPPLPLLPSIARVVVTSHGSAIAVTHDINLPRGDWRGEALHFHVAFGAPGPRAIDARLLAVADGALEADPDDAGEPLATDRAARRPANAYGLLGRDTMAGIVVHLKPDEMKRALARGNMAMLRLRAVADATEPDRTGATSVVVRLGASRGTPLTLGRIVASAVPPGSVGRVEAQLCGGDADSQPLAVGIVGRPPAHGSAIAPILAVRHASDDLCLRLWP